MRTFRARLRRVGGSLGVLVPIEIVRDIDASEGETVEIAVLPSKGKRRARLARLAGSVPGLGHFEREREDRF